ncbi:hypothetical protein Pla110_37530 [Polystyrenella longa]|uniref:Peptidase MA-like domain-containing protein n=1 Tax=Polystyrenella longa TaxID=2528007 RepID=A0A518CRZ6_9PLAN|nr:hypothetical protein [Polystyrenella longa]QDU82001.1 hypothetical protein Pla110_37530 [Polystyrenella longa]
MRLRLTIYLSLLLCSSIAYGAKYKTDNFVVTAPSEIIAKQVALTAEDCRKEIAIAWLGAELPGNWENPCKVFVKVGQLGAGGATTFKFNRGEVYGWDMEVQGTLERILDSVIPHEVSHTIFASYFRRPLPRWADEGAATIVEHISEKRRQLDLLHDVIDSDRRIPVKQLLEITEYPKNPQDVFTLYAEGFSLADFLIEAGGRKRFLDLIDVAHEQDWETAFRKIYKLDDLNQLENHWRKWIVAGSPRNQNNLDGVEVAVAEKSSEDSLIRGQSPDPKQISKPVFESSPKMTADRSLLIEESADRLERPQPLLLRISSKR